MVRRAGVTVEGSARQVFHRPIVRNVSETGCVSASNHRGVRAADDLEAPLHLADQSQPLGRLAEFPHRVGLVFAAGLADPAVAPPECGHPFQHEGRRHPSRLRQRQPLGGDAIEDR